MRTLLCIILLLTGCASIPAVDTYFSAARASSVQVRTATSGGSGVIINSHCVLTVAHVASEKTFEAKTHSGQVSTFTTVIADHGRDIAIGCTAGTLDGPPVRIAAAMPDIYSQIFVIGFPLGFSEVLTEGRYEGADLVSAPLAPGNSGGGVFNARGELIGLADAIPVVPNVGAFAHLAMVVKVDTIHTYLAENNNGCPSCS